MNYSSRWKRYTDSGARKQAIGLLTITGILLVLFIIFGFPLLLNLASKIGSLRKTTNSTATEIITIPDPPQINIGQTATKSASFTITGFAQGKIDVELLQNEVSQGIESADDNGQFKFDVSLNKGKNIFSARAINQSKQSPLSNIYEVYLLDKEPKLTIDSPKDGDKFSTDNFVDIKGLTDSGVTILINNRLAVVNSDGSFKLRLTLKNGDNQITIVARDQAKNEAKKELKVNYNPD